MTFSEEELDDLEFFYQPIWTVDGEKARSPFSLFGPMQGMTKTMSSAVHMIRKMPNVTQSVILFVVVEHSTLRMIEPLLVFEGGKPAMSLFRSLQQIELSWRVPDVERNSTYDVYSVPWYAEVRKENLIRDRVLKRHQWDQAQANHDLLVETRAQNKPPF